MGHVHVFSFVSTICNSQLTSSNIGFFSTISFDLINRFICQHLAFDGVVHIFVILRAIENLRKYLKDRTQVHRPTLFYTGTQARNECSHNCTVNFCLNASIEF